MELAVRDDLWIGDEAMIGVKAQMSDGCPKFLHRHLDILCGVRVEAEVITCGIEIELSPDCSDKVKDIHRLRSIEPIGEKELPVPCQRDVRIAITKNDHDHCGMHTTGITHGYGNEWTLKMIETWEANER